ncbi:MAG TPA: hypothetical protein VH143_22170 [Kofleriaceae bacterium]|nr:hypothetical protein [Kofleriaceae bacterium]
MIERLGPESRALVDTARDGLGPDDVAVRRMRGHIATAVASGAAVAGLAAGAHSATAATASATSSIAAGSVAAKIAVIAVVAAGATVGTRAVITHRASPRPAVMHVAPAPIVVAAPPVHVVVPPPPTEAVEPSVVVDSPPAAPPPRARVRAQVAAVAPVPPVAPPSLARETELLDAALDAVAQRRFADAIAAIGRYRDATAGHGQLAEDADAIEIEALCRLDDARSGAAFAAFSSRWPHAHDIARLRAVCRR